MMYLKIFMIYLIINGSWSADMDMFQRLYEAQDKGGKATVCVSDISNKSPRLCLGVLWRQSWLLVRASCVKYASDTYVQKGISNCTTSNSTITSAKPQCDDEMCIQYVIAIYMHPRFPAIDLAMLRLDAPFIAETRAFSYDLEQKLDEWEKFITDYYSTNTEGNIQIRHYEMYTTPIKMFVITVILPTVSFALFFLYVVFYTGSSDKVLGIPYTSLTNKEENQKFSITESKMSHPEYPQSNIAKFSGYDPNKYALDEVSPTVTTDDSLTPNQPARLTQRTVNKFLRPLTKDLDEVPPRPTINELTEAVIDKMVQKDKAFWVDKPGANAYTLTDAYYNYGMTTEKVLSPHQDVFPRSCQYDLDCVKYRRLHACDGLKQSENIQKPLAAYCRTCTTTKGNKIYETASDSTQKRWRYYPDLIVPLTPQQLRQSMDEVGRPFKNEACNWYYKNYPPVKYNCIMRKFSK